MGKTLKQEFYLLWCRRGAWVLLLLALLGCFLIEIIPPVGAERWTCRIDAKCIELISKTDAQWHVDYYRQSAKTRHDKELIGLGDVYGLPPGSVKNAEEIYAALTEAEYARVMWFGGGLLALCLFLPTVLIRYPLDRGVPDWSARFCGSRRRVARAKIWVFYFLGALFGLLCTLILVFVYARDILERQGLGFVLYTLAAHTLMELAVLSVPMYLAFRVSSSFFLLGCSTLYGVLCYAVNVAAHTLDGMLFIPFPAWLHGLRCLWQPEGPKLWLLVSALVSLVYILVFGLLSIRSFSRNG